MKFKKINMKKIKPKQFRNNLKDVLNYRIDLFYIYNWVSRYFNNITILISKMIQKSKVN